MENNIKSKETIAQEALRLLSTVPEDKWTTFSYTDLKEKCCAIGHYNRLKSKNQNDYSSRNCSDDCGPDTLRQKSAEFLKAVHNAEYGDLATVNNTTNINGYKQESIKERVINCLADMVKSGY